MSSVVKFEQKDRYVVITMDDGKANAVSPVLLEELNLALDHAENTRLPIVLTGRQGKFSAGFDLSVMNQGGAAMGQLVAAGAKLSYRLLSSPAPVIAACNGHALAMGALLLLSVDYRIGAVGNFKIGLNEVAIGMTMPHFGVELARYRLHTPYLGRAVTNAEVFSPLTAVEAGYLDSSISEANLLEEATQIAMQLGAVNMAAHHATKMRVRKPLLAAVAAGIETEFGVSGF